MNIINNNLSFRGIRDIRLVTRNSNIPADFNPKGLPMYEVGVFDIKMRALLTNDISGNHLDEYYKTLPNKNFLNKRNRETFELHCVNLKVPTENQEKTIFSVNDKAINLAKKTHRDFMSFLEHLTNKDTFTIDWKNPSGNELMFKINSFIKKELKMKR